MIRELSDTVGEAVLTRVGQAVSHAQERRPLPADLLESEDAFLAIFDAAGVASQDVTVTFEEGRIRVHLDRSRAFDGYEMVFPGRGVSLGGSLKLPDGSVVDPDAATATLKDNGTLHVHLPKVDSHARDETHVEVTDESDGGQEHNGEGA